MIQLPDGWRFDFTGAMLQIEEAMAEIGRRAEAAAADAQLFHDAWHRAAEDDWRSHFFVHPADAWWELR